MTKQVAIYVRVSTNQQTVQNQLSALREVAERSGYTR
jgi:DNA invertase Pin-like site-specific DNA recombinase